MPREEDLPPSKGGRLMQETEKETKRFTDFIGDNPLFSQMNDRQRVDFLLTHMNKQNAIYNLIIEDKQDQIDKLKERLKKLEDEIL